MTTAATATAPTGVWFCGALLSSGCVVSSDDHDCICSICVQHNPTGHAAVGAGHETGETSAGRGTDPVSDVPRGSRGALPALCDVAPRQGMATTCDMAVRCFPPLWLLSIGAFVFACVFILMLKLHAWRTLRSRSRSASPADERNRSVERSNSRSKSRSRSKSKSRSRSVDSRRSRSRSVASRTSSRSRRCAASHLSADGQHWHRDIKLEPACMCRGVFHPQKLAFLLPRTPMPAGRPRARLGPARQLLQSARGIQTADSWQRYHTFVVVPGLPVCHPLVATTLLTSSPATAAGAPRRHLHPRPKAAVAGRKRRRSARRRASIPCASKATTRARSRPRRRNPRLPPTANPRLWTRVLALVAAIASPCLLTSPTPCGPNSVCLLMG